MKIASHKRLTSSSTIKATALAVGLFVGGACLAESIDYEDTSSKYQATYNWQKHPSFNNGNTPNAVNSLYASSEHMFTFSTTAHWGMRTWEGGEVYFNPEIAAGVPFSTNLVGLGGLYQRRNHASRGVLTPSCIANVCSCVKHGTTVAALKKSDLTSIRWLGP